MKIVWAERGSMFSKDGELLFCMNAFGNTGWYRWSVFPTQLDPAAQWEGGEKMNKKKCCSIQCELRNKESVNWPGNKELGIRRKFQRNPWVKKPHSNISSAENQGTKMECWVPADLSSVAPNEKSTWPCFGTFIADVRAWNSTWGWRSDKASWLQYLWGWRAGCAGCEEQLAFFISPMAGQSGRLWKSIQMPPSIKRDKARLPGEVNPGSFICLCVLLESLLLLQHRSPSLQAEQSAASLGESWGSWNIDTRQAGSWNWVNACTIIGSIFEQETFCIKGCRKGLFSILWYVRLTQQLLEKKERKAFLRAL